MSRRRGETRQERKCVVRIRKWMLGNSRGLDVPRVEYIDYHLPKPNQPLFAGSCGAGASELALSSFAAG